MFPPWISCRTIHILQTFAKMAFPLRSVLISDEVDLKCVTILQNNGINVEKNTKLSKEELLAKIPSFDGLIVRSATKVTAEVIKAGTNLKIIGRAGTGVDNIDCDAATKKGIIVMNTPGGNTMSAAEHTCAMLMAMSRHISHGTESLHAGRWDRKKLMGNEVFGKTLAIIGLGRIGKEVATRMQAFGMKTIGYDPIIPGEVSAQFGVEWLPLDQIWPQADYVTVHTPLIPQTKNLIGAEVFSKCKKGMRVINVARGGIIDEDALLQALNAGQCGGAALDVFVQEPPTNSELIKHPLLTCTPHLGASTSEAQSRVAEEIAEQFVDLAKGKKLFGAINADALVNSLSPHTKPWVQLGKSLGKLAASVIGGVKGPIQMTVHTQGDDLSQAGSYLKAACLMGVLKPQTSNGLNLVSAPAYAKELGIQAKSEHTAGGSAVVTLTVLLPEGGQTLTLKGQACGGYPVLISINGATFSQPVALDGHMLVYKSQSNPQVLSAVIGALAGNDAVPQGISLSVPANGEQWTTVQLSKPVTDLGMLKLHVSFAQQLVF